MLQVHLQIIEKFLTPKIVALSCMAQCFVFVQPSELGAAEIRINESLQIQGDLLEGNDLSAIQAIQNFLAIGSDEIIGRKKQKRNVIQLLRPDGVNGLKIHSTIPLCSQLNDDGGCKTKSQRKEMDIEAMAVEGDVLYVIGSHSMVRKRVKCDATDSCSQGCKSDRTYAKNRSVFLADLNSSERPHTGRDRLLRLTLDASGRATNFQEQSLGPIIERLSVLKPFARIPSKENGIDIEGLATRDETLFVGFRGPVFRGGFVPVLKTKFGSLDSVSDDNVVYLKLGGRGIRSLARVSDGFLVLAGPVGNGTGSFQLYHWDGRDTVPGLEPRPDPIGKVELLGDISRPACSNPEGMTVNETGSGTYEVIVVFDGAADVVARRFTVMR